MVQSRERSGNPRQHSHRPKETSIMGQGDPGTEGERGYLGALHFPGCRGVKAERAGQAMETEVCPAAVWSDRHLFQSLSEVDVRFVVAFSMLTWVSGSVGFCRLSQSGTGLTQR